ncbi:uncharacterized protein YkwD [Folsomia candida]|uniref:uncharacterized protein YkwD n=1 Tax=Folsomia candida TaxID=158441 RepID=UPI000B8FAAE6|nr:uncharacterized protein YkwD [Folsomia candida]
MALPVSLTVLVVVLGCNGALSSGIIGNSLSVKNFESDAIGNNNFGTGETIETRAAGLCLDDHNSYRSQNGKGPLAYSSQLEQAARNHNSVMTSKNCFSHQCSGEPSLGDRVSATGYRWTGAGENIAAGQGDCKSVMNSWMNSSGHKANILGNFKHVGCAVQDCSNCSYNKYWTCVFGNQ